MIEKMIEKFTLGTDPELFLYDVEKKEFIPSELVLGRYNKDSPMEIGDGYNILCDNAMLEFNIPPAYSLEEFIENISQAMSLIRSNCPEQLQLKFVPTATFSEEYKDLPGMNEFGCAPSLNAYSEAFEKIELEGLTRHAGGHVHIGLLDKDSKTINLEYEDLIRLIKYLDIYLGIAATEIDKDKERRDSYGKLGEFRVTDYGLEYRSLSNFWLEEERHSKWLYNQVEKAISAFNNQEELPSDEEIQNEFTITKKLITA